MEKYRPNSEQLNESIEASLEAAQNQVDILAEHGFDMKKIGELIRVIDYLRSAAKGGEAVLPEPDPDLYKKVIWNNLPNRIPIQSPDRVFAQMVYGVIPEGVKRGNINGACEILNDFLSGLVKETEETKQIRPPKAKINK